MMWIANLYLFMLIFRPFEYWAALQDFYLERITLAAFILAALYSKTATWRSSPINAAVGAFLASHVLATVFSVNFSVSFDYLYELFKFCLLYYIFLAIQTTPRDTLNLILGYIAVMALYVGKSAWEFFVNGRYVYRMGIIRMVGLDQTLGDPNSFAASMAYSLPWAVLLLRHQGCGRKTRLGVAAYIVMALVAMVFTGSRSGQITCLLLGLMLLASSSRKLLYLSIASVLLLGAWLYMPEDYQQRFESAFNHDVGPANAAESAKLRTIAFLEAMDIFSDHPFVGIGPGMFKRYSPLGMSPHNLYGQLLSESGIIGMAFFLIFLLALFREMYRLRIASRRFSIQSSEPPLSSLVVAAGFQTIILLLFNGMASHNLYRFNWQFVAAILAATASRPMESTAPQAINKPRGG